MTLARSNVLKIENYRPNFVQEEKAFLPAELSKTHYLKTILEISQKYLEQDFSDDELEEFYLTIKHIQAIKDRKIIIAEFLSKYVDFIKLKHQRSYLYSDKKLNDFIKTEDFKTKIIWGDAFRVLEKLDNESVQLMVTSPP